jgi:hypothetical protein
MPWLNGFIFRDADLTGANLSGTVLSRTDLRGAILTGADLSSAQLYHTDLERARVDYADFRFAYFWPDSLPTTSSMATAKNLHDLKFDEDSSALAKLRHEFRLGGFRSQERRITYVLKAAETEKIRNSCRQYLDILSCTEYAFNRIFLDLTTQYGMSPWRPLHFSWCGLEYLRYHLCCVLVCRAVPPIRSLPHRL